MKITELLTVPALSKYSRLRARKSEGENERYNKDPETKTAFARCGNLPEQNTFFNRNFPLLDMRHHRIGSV